MLPILHQILYELIRLLQPLFVPICFVLAWLLVVAVIWSVISALGAAIHSAKIMHRIPCANCQFFTNTHYLKCPVHPSTALSQEAINCPDYRSSGYKALIEE
ncbi:MAG: hypothetical protein ACKO7W_24700 [Elainella sp.]